MFHVYRHLRRRENDRQAIIENNAAVEEQDREFQEKRLANKMADDERTSKKRAKRYVCMHQAVYVDAADCLDNPS